MCVTEILLHASVAFFLPLFSLRSQMILNGTVAQCKTDIFWMHAIERTWQMLIFKCFGERGKDWQLCVHLCLLVTVPWWSYGKNTLVFSWYFWPVSVEPWQLHYQWSLYVYLKFILQDFLENVFLWQLFSNFMGNGIVWMHHCHLFHAPKFSRKVW